MESHPRTALRPDGLRPLNAPQPLAVRLNAAGCPQALQLGSNSNREATRSGTRSNSSARSNSNREATRSGTRSNSSARSNSNREATRSGTRSNSSARSNSNREAGARSNRKGAPWLTVLEIDESWRVVDEWWRATGVDRTYYRLLAAREGEEAGRLITIFHEASEGEADSRSERSGEWFVQHYA